jgi:hypothetical protein
VGEEERRDKFGMREGGKERDGRGKAGLWREGGREGGKEGRRGGGEEGKRDRGNEGKEVTKTSSWDRSWILRFLFFAFFPFFIFFFVFFFPALVRVFFWNGNVMVNF